LTIRSVAIFLSIATIGCSKPSAEFEPKGQPPEELYTIKRDVKDDRLLNIKESFEHFGELAKFVKSAPDLTIYEGLPHDIWEPETYESELKNAMTIELDGSQFYAAPVAVTKDVVERLRMLASSRSSFIPFQGYKTCGGFHADWCLSWQNGEETHPIQVCFSCSEIMAFETGGKRYLYCDIWDSERFKLLLDQLHTNRPKPRE
jgi:hypothetical protein